MKVQEIPMGLHYLGEVTGARQTYHVFQGQAHYLLLSWKKGDPRSGNFNVVTSEAVAQVEQRFAGRKGLTAKALLEESKHLGHFRDRFHALNVLYALVAAGKASIDHRYKAGALVFNLAG